MAAVARDAKRSRESNVFQWRRRRGIPKRSSAVMPPASRGELRRSRSWTTALDSGVVLTVSVAVTGTVPETAAGAVTEQVGVSTAPVGLPATAQVRVTVPVEPPVGVIVTMDVPVLPGDGIPMELPARVKLGAGGGTTPITVKGMETLVS
jgi:hypothetical protein